MAKKKIDWKTVGARVKADRERLHIGQGEYGVTHLDGLSQSRVSELESGNVKRPSGDLLERLRERLGPLPEIGQSAMAEEMVGDLIRHVERELARIRPDARAEVVEHLKRQASLLVVGREDEPHAAGGQRSAARHAAGAGTAREPARDGRRK